MRPLILSTLAAFLFIFVNTSHAQRDRGLTEVVREECLSFPKVTSPENMKEGVHYTKGSYCWREDYQGRCEVTHYYLSFKYFYLKKSIIDYYSSDGRLITTKKDSQKLELYVGTGDIPADAEKAIVPKIDEKIFTSSETVCGDSFYK